jgi:hypothetical protein
MMGSYIEGCRRETSANNLLKLLNTYSYFTSFAKNYNLIDKKGTDFPHFSLYG